MRLLHVTDLHFNRVFFEWVFRERKDYDGICLTGDFLSSHGSERVSKNDQSLWVVDWFNQFDTPLFICSGNHDCVQPSQANDLSIEELFQGYDDEHTENFESVFDVDLGCLWLREISNKNISSDSSITDFNGVKIGCIPYGSENLSDFFGCNILLHHVPPKGTPQCTSSGQDFGCDRIKLHISHGLLKPDYLLTGHVHAPESVKSKLCNTWVINPGARDAGKEPKYAIIRI